MTRTPGVLARRVAGSWSMDGSYILRVPTFANLPAAPADDDVFAFVHDTAKLYRSRAGSWIEFTSGGGAVTTAGYFGSALGPISISGNPVDCPIGSVRLNNGFTVVGNTVRCDVAGTYHVTAALTFTAGLQNQWIIIGINQWRGAAKIVGYDHVSMSPSSAAASFVLQTAAGEFTLQAGDQLLVNLSVSSVASPYIQVDGRSSLTISAVGGIGPKGDKGDPGTTGMVGTVLHSGVGTADLGSQTVGGLRDLVTTTIPVQTVPCFVHTFGFVSIGFGTGTEVICDIDLIRIRDGAVFDGVVGHAGSRAGVSTRYPIYSYDVVAAGANPNVKSRCNGLDFKGGNCYMSSRVQWIVTAS